MLVYKDLHWWTVLRIYQIFLVKLKIFLSKMQVNTKEILLNHPSKGLAHCALVQQLAGEAHTFVFVCEADMEILMLSVS